MRRGLPDNGGTRRRRLLPPPPLSADGNEGLGCPAGEAASTPTPPSSAASIFHQIGRRGVEYDDGLLHGPTVGQALPPPQDSTEEVNEQGAKQRPLPRSLSIASSFPPYLLATFVPPMTLAGFPRGSAWLRGPITWWRHSSRLGFHHLLASSSSSHLGFHHNIR